MLTLTDDARLAIRGLTEPTDTRAHGGIRIAATSPAPVNGAGSELALNLADGPVPGDLVIDQDGARVFLDETAAALLDEQTLDVEINETAEEVSFYLAPH